MNTRSELERRLPTIGQGRGFGTPSRRTLCSKAEGQFIAALARIIGDPTGTIFWASMWSFPFFLGACKEFNLRFHHGR
jgi:hypothetical protein